MVPQKQAPGVPRFALESKQQLWAAVAQAPITIKLLAKTLLRHGAEEALVKIFADASHHEHAPLSHALDLIGASAPDWGDILGEEIMLKVRLLRANEQVGKDRKRQKTSNGNDLFSSDDDDGDDREPDNDTSRNRRSWMISR
jgi:hypothetical protein